MKSSTQDKIEGTAKDVKGVVKQQVGKATGNPARHDEGTADRIEGQTQKKVGDIKKVFGK